MEGIAARATGQYPLSIATSLALESACGIHPDIQVPKPPILAYQELWINVKTLFRNLMGALDKTTASMVSHHEMGGTLIEEMEVIRSIIADVSYNTKVQFYINELLNMEEKYPHAYLREDHTPKQKEYTAILNNTIESFLDRNVELGIALSVRTLRVQVPTTAMILTHVPYDLFSRKLFNELVLLESHTGTIKKFPQWYTKYFNGKELTMLPFREDLIQVFGDTETFRPMPLKVRNEVIELAKRDNWTAVTTRDKILYGINTLEDKELKELLWNILV